MISMSQQHSIRQLRAEGESVAGIARKIGVSRNTVYSHLADEDLSPKMPTAKRGKRLLDPYRKIIAGWLEEDRREWRKQRHTAHRIWTRLRDEHGVVCGESTVRRYVRELKAELGVGRKERYLELAWRPAEAQADFGEADFSVYGVRRRLSYFTLTFPHSNTGFAQVFPAENAECVCQALKNVFEHVGGVPSRIVFDNAAGVGRRVSETVRTTELFAAFAAHYNFAFSFCNPNSGHEKGSVEAKVRYLRSNLFVPVPKLYDLARYNERLLGACEALSKDHYRKETPEEELFAEDRLAMAGLPERPFDVVRYERRRADKWGKITLEGHHRYSSDPAFSGARLIVALRATSVEFFTEDGELIARHPRAYGKAPTDTTDPASQLALLANKTGAWRNSRVREALPDDLRAHMDALDKSDLAAELRVMRDQCAHSGWRETVSAMASCLEGAGRIDEAGVALAAARAATGEVVYDEPVDLSAYDRAVGVGEVA